MRLPLRRARQLVGLALVAPLLATACAVNPAGQAPTSPLAVRTAPVATTNVSGTISYSGNVTARSTVNVLPKIVGEITKLNVDVGSHVKKGDVIAEIDHSTLDAQVAQAKAALEGAQAHLATINAGPRPESVAEAKANLAAAQAKLKFIESGGRPESVAAAQSAVQAATDRLNGLEVGRPDAIAQAKANLQAAEARLQALKDGPTSDQVKAAELGVEQAKDAANSANVAKDAACNPALPAAGCKSAQAAAYAAQTGVSQAETKLKILTAPPTATQLSQAQAAVNAAKAQLQMAEKPGSASEIAAAKSAVAASQAQLALAKAPFSGADLAGAHSAVDVAQQQLKLAEDPYTPQDKTAAVAAVHQAQAALEMATVTRDEAIIRAPITGVVAKKFLAIGAMASPQSPIVSLIDPSVDVVVNVGQDHVTDIHLGDLVKITADALPGKSIPGKVTTIAPSINPQSRTLEVKVTPTVTNSGLKDGLLAKVSFVTATRKGVLAVPSNAIVQINGQPTVFVVSNGVATPKVVKTGLTDGHVTEITSGLKAGDQVVVSGQDQLSGAQPVTVQK